jgi:hypothetical protein
MSVPTISSTDSPQRQNGHQRYHPDNTITVTTTTITTTELIKPSEKDTNDTVIPLEPESHVSIVFGNTFDIVPGVITQEEFESAIRGLEMILEPSDFEMVVEYTLHIGYLTPLNMGYDGLDEVYHVPPDASDSASSILEDSDTSLPRHRELILLPLLLLLLLPKS